MKNSLAIFERMHASHLAQLQNVLDFPPAPKLNTQGRLDQFKTAARQPGGEKVFFGKRRRVSCHAGTGRRPNKDFHVAGHRRQPAYRDDGRLRTLEDTAEFFNLVLQLKLTDDDKSDLVAYMRQL